MADLNLSQDVANKKTAAHIVANSNPIQQAARMRRYGSLININPSASSDSFGKQLRSSALLKSYLKNH